MSSPSRRRDMDVMKLSGSVCMDVISQSWSPMFASIMMKDRKLYDQKVKEYCDRYAKKENISNSTADEERGDEEDISEGESRSSDNEIPGHADP